MLTEAEQMDLLKTCGVALTAHTGKHEVGVVLVMAFHGEPPRVHCISNLPSERAQELLETYVGLVRDRGI